MSFAILLTYCCQFTHAQEYVLQKLGPSISSPDYDEIAPCVSQDGKTMYFTRIAHPKFERSLIENGIRIKATDSLINFNERLSEIYGTIGGVPVEDPVNSDYNQDIWIAHSAVGEFDLLEHPGYPLNNALPNSVSALTGDDELIVLNQFAPQGGMQKGFSSVTRSAQSKWQFPQPIGIDGYYNSGADVNLTLGQNGKVMIIAMEREDSYGDTDLYISFKKRNGNWTYPENLGPKINTPHRESAPHLSADMLSLYFASDREAPGEGNDIYVQSRMDGSWEDWWFAKRFTHPINSAGEDSHPYFNEATGYLYFTSDRDGSSDIYRIQIDEPVGHPQFVDHSNYVSLSVGSSIEIDNIYFEQSTANVLRPSQVHLQKLSWLLTHNPNLVIRIDGHTDNVGDKKLLQKLSEDRAKAIKTYLVLLKGIAPDRVKIYGYGDTRPLNENRTEAEKKANRRVEITVVSNDAVVFNGTP